MTEGNNKLSNPRRWFFQRLATAAVHDANQQRDGNALQFATKAIVRTTMSLNYHGSWEERKLSDDLKRIIAKPREYFEGKEVAEEIEFLKDE